MEFKSQLNSLSQETLCHILSFLPIADILSMGITCKKLYTATKLYLRLCKKLDLCDTQVLGHLPTSFYDDQLHSLLSKCPKLEVLHGLRPQKVENRRLRRKIALSVPGILDALLLCPHLKRVETNSFEILNAMLRYLPSVEVDGQFRNEEITKNNSDLATKQYLKWNAFPLITSLHLTKTYLSDIGFMPKLEYLYLQWVRFYRFEPFQRFEAPQLKSFIMKQCCGQDLEMGYMALFVALCQCKKLERLECVSLSVPGGLIQRVVDESWNIKSFQNLKKLVMIDNKYITPNDVGYLMIAACSSLESISLSPGLLSDNFFASLKHASVNFCELKSLSVTIEESLWTKHALADFNTVWGQQSFRNLEHSTISDRGMKTIGHLFPNLEFLTLSHCPHLNNFLEWRGQYNGFSHLRELSLRHCYCLDVDTLSNFIKCLESIEVLIFKDMFLAGPKGCSHMGLSAGTGLGMDMLVIKEREEAILVNVFDDPLVGVVARRDQDADFLNFYNVNNGIECGHDRDDHTYVINRNIKKELDTGLYPEEVVSSPSSSFKGPITRNRSRIILAQTHPEAKRFHQSTQTCFSFLQQNNEFHNPHTHQSPLRNCCPNTCVNCNCYQDTKTFVCEDYPFRKQKTHKVTLSIDQETSTNDPVQESESMGAIFRLSSNTLRSLTLISCGISNVNIYQAPELEHLEVQACSQLETVWYEPCLAKVKRINVSHCPLFRYDSFVLCLAINSYSEPQCMAIKPHIKSNVQSIMRKLENSFTMILQSHTFAILYDFSQAENDRGYYRENLLSWMKFTRNIMRACSVVRVERPVKSNENFIYRRHGQFSDGSDYELVTNNPILVKIFQKNERSPEINPFVMYPEGSNVFKELVKSIEETWCELEACGFIADNYRGCYVQFGDFPTVF